MPASPRMAASVQKLSPTRADVTPTDRATRAIASGNAWPAGISYGGRPNISDDVADHIYDVAVDRLFASFFEDEDAVRESMIDGLQIGSGARVLEIGCGTGRDSFNEPVP